MIMKDFKYIIKRILIGVGICVCLFYLKSCNVYAQESQLYSSYYYNQKIVSNTQTYNCHSVGDSYLFVIDDYEYIIDYKSTGLYINDVQVESNLNYASCNSWILGKFVSSGNVTLYYAYGTSGSVAYNHVFDSGSVLNYSDNFPLVVDHLATGSSSYNRKRINFSNGNFLSQNTSQVYSCTAGGVNYSGCFLTGYDFMVFGTDSYYRIFPYNSSNVKWITSDFSSPHIQYNYPSIVSLNPTLNKTSDNMLVSVSFDIEFSYINNDYYNYYAWFEGYDKMKLTTNNVILNTQQNTTLYVEITDKNGNNIDSETFNVSSIGLIYNGDYDIQFLSQEFSESDTTNDSDAYVDYINRVDIDVTYIPQWINYKYYYQFVNSGNTLDENSWVLLNNNSAKNNFVYTTNVNGNLYARILDSDDNVLYSSVFNVSTIGNLKVYDKNSGKIFNMFNNIKNNVNFGGPISNLIVAPVNVLETILESTTNRCVPYDMGSINGHRIILDCIEPDDYLGSTLWSTIDIIISFCLSYSIIKWITSLYYGFVMLQNTPDIDDSHFDRKSNSLF